MNFLLNRTFQNKFCVLDLTKFCFKYSKDPKEKFKTILLKDVIDVVLETDPQRTRTNSSSLFSKRDKPGDEGYNFNIKTIQRNYRMQAGTKPEQLMWSRAFTVLFDLRARISQNLRTTVDIDNYLGLHPEGETEESE